LAIHQQQVQPYQVHNIDLEAQEVVEGEVHRGCLI